MSIYLLDWFKFPTIGEVSFACSSTEYSWQVPVGVTSITAVCIAGGGGGHAGTNQKQGAGGGGGGLRWINHMPVVPGEILLVKAGLGGTGCDTQQIVNNTGRLIAWGRPGQDSYIASNNNANVRQRVGIGGTIIVRSQGGGQDFYVTDQIRITPPGSNTAGNPVSELNASNPDASNTDSVGRAGGTGSTLGSFSWGTIGGGNGGDGGGGGGGGGGQDGGGGGSGGWFGSGGRGGEATGDGSLPPTNGTGGGGGGGMFGSGGGASAGGGGGGTGVFWGIGPHGVNGFYYWNGAIAIQVTASQPTKSAAHTGAGGQGGSFGKDGRATGAELMDDTNYIKSGSFFGDPLININYFNNSEGNGKRGYSGSVDNIYSVPVVIPNGGEYGGGGGAAQTSGGPTSDKPISGKGGCGHVRILFVARSQNIVREYGFGRTTQVRNLNGGNFTVKFYDYNPSLTLTQNRNAGWPAWYQVGSGEYYNILVNWAVDVPGREALPLAVGIGTNPSNYPI